MLHPLVAFAPDHDIPHEDAAGRATDRHLRGTSNQAHIPNAAVAAGANPTKAEYDALVGKFNLVLGVLRDAELIPSS
jgi:hypothetical protein